MDVAFIHPKYPGAGGNGASIHATKFLSAIQSSNVDVTVYCRDLPSDDSDVEVDVPVKEFELPKRPYQIHRRLNKAVFQHKSEFETYDVLHSQLSSLLPAVSSIGAEMDTSTIVTLHEYSQICPKSIGTFRFLDRSKCTSNGVLKCSACSVATLPGLRNADGDYNYLYRLSGRLVRSYQNSTPYENIEGIDRLHVLSPHVKSKYVEFGYPRQKFHVIPDILEERFVTTSHDSYREPYQLLYVGRLDERKGVSKLVPLMERVLERTNLDVRLTIVGTGGAEELIKAQLDDSPVEESINLTGYVPDDRLPHLYQESDVFIYPGSWDEPFGVVFLEALGAGLPIVSSDVGSVGSIIGDAGIITGRSIQSLSEAVLQILHEEDLKQLSQNATSEAERYREEIVINDILKMYDSV